jgi:hypothetical protein
MDWGIFLAALRRMGYAKEELSAYGNGVRVKVRAVLDAVLQVRPDIIKYQLAHLSII